MKTEAQNPCRYTEEERRFPMVRLCGTLTSNTKGVIVVNYSESTLTPFSVHLEGHWSPTKIYFKQGKYTTDTNAMTPEQEVTVCKICFYLTKLLTGSIPNGEVHQFPCEEYSKFIHYMSALCKGTDHSRYWEWRSEAPELFIKENKLC